MRKKIIGICSVEGCDRPIKSRGFCGKHYQLEWIRLVKDGGRLTTGTKRRHPYYAIWFERKQTNDLVPEWLNFWKFVDDIGEKPGPNYFLVRLRDAPYGPDNFQWYEKLKRKPDESIRAFNARKWKSRRLHFPNFDNERQLKRKYGITLFEYDKMFADQGGCCAICKQPERSYSHHTNGIKRLSVDHSHKTGKVRALLCFRCNSTIGRIGEDHDLMLAMSQYLKKHA